MYDYKCSIYCGYLNSFDYLKIVEKETFSASSEHTYFRNIPADSFINLFLIIAYNRFTRLKSFQSISPRVEQFFVSI